MFDYCGVYTSVSTRSSHLFYIDFCLSINRLEKQDLGKILLPFFFWGVVKARTYSSAFETITTGILRCGANLDVFVKHRNNSPDPMPIVTARQGFLGLSLWFCKRWNSLIYFVVTITTSQKICYENIIKTLHSLISCRSSLSS